MKLQRITWRWWDGKGGEKLNVFSRIAKGIKNAIVPEKTVNMQSQELLEWLGISSTPKKLVSEVTYFTCLKKLISY